MTLHIHKNAHSREARVGEQRRHHAGSSSVEYALVIAIIVTFVIGVAGVMSNNLATFFNDAGVQLQSFVSGGNGGDANGQRANPPDAGTVTSRGDVNANPRANGESNDDEGGGGFWGSVWGGAKQVGGVFKGAGEQLVDTVVGLGTLAYDGTRLTPPFSLVLDRVDPEGQAAIRDKYLAVVEAVFTDPVGVLAAVVEPITTDWQDGNYGEAIGRGVFEVATIVVTPAKLGKVGKLAKLEKAIPEEIAIVERVVPDEVLDEAADIEKAVPDEALDNAPRRVCSFRGDMLVATVDGYKPIAKMAVGDHVLAKDEFSGDVNYMPVIERYQNVYRATVYIEILSDDANRQTIVSNRIHPFYVGGEWIQADALKYGDELVTEVGATSMVTAVRVTEEQLDAFNLNVANYHTYFIKAPDAAAYDGIWVHNQCLRPEAGYLRGKKHGIKWKEGSARAKATGNPQGQWGSKADLDFAGEKAGTLQPRQGDWFDLPDGYTSVVHMPDGTTVPATRIWVRNNGNGTFHGYPAP